MIHPKTPFIKTRVQPKVLYNDSSNTRIVKVQNTFEYYHYLSRRKEYQQQQEELLEGLRLENQQLQQLTYSVKCFGVSNKEGKFGVQSQRKFMGGSFEQQPTYEVNVQIQAPDCQQKGRKRQIETPLRNYRLAGETSLLETRNPFLSRKNTQTLALKVQKITFSPLARNCIRQRKSQVSILQSASFGGSQS